MDITKQTIATDLLALGAVFLRPDEPFTWASGIKSPIYCDNRLTLSSPEVRGRVEQGLAAIIRREWPSCQLVAGTSTSGIAHAALVSDILGLPMCYVRPSAKGHGRGNQIEGRAEAGRQVVVVEDLISTGGSVLEVVQALRGAGCRVLGIVSIFTYNLAAAAENLAAAAVHNVSLCDYEALIEVAAAENYVRAEDLPRLRAFRANPRDEGWME
jgi:orotate phosphoribosyltransferase